MDFPGDERAQSVQVGAVLLFAVLILAFSSYQAFVVPDQNSEIEFKHNQQVHTQIQDLRNSIVSVPGTSSPTAVSVQLGTQYPSRAIARNPGPPSGSLRANGSVNASKNVTLSNAKASGETGEYWTGDDRHLNSGTMVYSPNYNVYEAAPDTYFEHSVAYNRFREGTVVLTGQTLVDGREITLVALNGSVSETASGSTSLDVEPVSRSVQTVRMTNTTGDNVEVRFLSRLSADTWENDLLVNELQPNGGHVTAVNEARGPGPFNTITIQFAQGVDYRVRLAKAGVGTQVTEEEAAYLTNETDTSVTLSTDETADLVVEARDGYNNPVMDRTVYVDVAGDNRTQDADEDGQVRITVDGDDLGTGTHKVNTSLDPIDGGYAASGERNVTFTVEVTAAGSGGGSNGAYAVDWLDPSGQSGVSCPNGPDGTCTVDAGQTGSATLTMGTTPVADGATVEYALNDSSIGSLSQTTGVTNASGENQTTFSPTNDGGLNVYATSGSGGDTLTLNVINSVNDLIYNNDAVAVDGPDADTETGGVEFSISNSFGQPVEITDVTVGSPGGQTRLNDELGAPNDEKRRTEVYIEGGANDGYVDVNNGVALPFTFDMDSDGFSNNGNPESSSGDTFTFYLYEFENNGGNRIDMSGQTFDVTVFYQLDDGTTGSKTFTITPS